MSECHVVAEPAEWNFEKLGHRGKKFPMPQRLRSTTLIVEIDGALPVTLLQRESDFVYYVLDGSGKFTIDGRLQSCVRGDLIALPAGTSFTYAGQLRMLLMATPPWNAENEEVTWHDGCA